MIVNYINTLYFIDCNIGLDLDIGNFDYEIYVYVWVVKANWFIHVGSSLLIMSFLVINRNCFQDT